MTSETLTTAQAAEYLSIPELEILYAIATGQLPATHNGYEIRISRGDLDAFKATLPRR